MYGFSGSSGCRAANWVAEGTPMQNTSGKVMSLATALAALTGTTAIVPETAKADAVDKTPPAATAVPEAPAVVPNRIMAVGDDLLGFTVGKAPDGTMLATHYSHYSHSSHSSHYSSSR